MFRKVLLASRVDLKEAIELANSLAKFLSGKGLSIAYEKDLASILGKEGVPLSQAVADLAVLVGGDGTVLRVVHRLSRNTPIFTVKMGRVGFFAEAIPENALDCLNKILNGEFIRDECFMLSTNICDFEALNEVRIGTVMPQQMMDLSVFVDDTRISRDRADAIVVATPIGSTAYALSAGAGVIDPRVETMLITPICPLSTNFKTYTVPSSSIVSIKPESKIDCVVLVDGQSPIKFDLRSEFKVWKSNRKTTFLRMSNNFYCRLKRRLKASSVDS